MEYSIPFDKKELKTLEFLFKNKVPPKYIDAKNFLKKYGFNDELAFEIGYMYDENYQEDGNFKSVEDPERMNYEDYLSEIPNEVKAIMQVVKDDDPENFELDSYNNRVTYEPDGIVYRIYDDFDDAKAEAIEYSSWLCDDPGENSEYYLSVSETDRRILAQEESDNIVDNLEDADIIDITDSGDEYDQIDEDEELAGQIGSKIDALTTKLSKTKSIETATKIKKSIELLTTKLRHTYGDLNFDKKREQLVDEKREELRDDKYNEIYDELGDPVQYFIHDNGLYTVEQLIKASFIFFDCDKMISDFVDDHGDLGSILSNNETEIEIKIGETTYYIYQTD